MSSILFLVLLAGVSPQTPPQTAAPQVSSPTVAPQVPQLLEPTPEYRIGPGDVISIHVSGVREFDQTTRVSNSGRIHVRYVGIMLVAGLNTVELESGIARAIKEHELVNEPSVRIQVEQYRSQPTYAVGELTNPGQFVITREMYLLDLIGMAGGLTTGASDKGYLYRRSWPKPSVESRIVGGTESKAAALPAPAAPTAPTPAVNPEIVQPVPTDDAQSVIMVNLKDLSEGTHPELNVKLQGGDILYVPRRRPDDIYVIGDVNVPGAYILPRRGQVTAAQAIIYAGGPLPTAKQGKAFLMRHDAAGNRTSIPVHFSEIIAGKQPDIPVQPDDIIFVPNSAVKTIGVGLLNMVPTIIQQWLIF